MYNFNNKTGDQILKDWKIFRKSLSDTDYESKIKGTINFWKNVPLVNFVLNYNEYKKWPSVWEIIGDNIYDSVALAYVISYTLIFSGIDEEDIVLKYVKPNDETDYIMIVILDNKYVLNYSYGEVTDIKDATWVKNLITLYFDKNKMKEK